MTLECDCVIVDDGARALDSSAGSISIQERRSLSISLSLSALESISISVCNKLSYYKPRALESKQKSFVVMMN